MNITKYDEIEQAKMTNQKEVDKMYRVKSIKGAKFFNSAGYTIGSGYGIEDVSTCKLVADKNSYHPWDYKSKSIATKIVEAFNTQGPAAVLYFAKVIE